MYACNQHTKSTSISRDWMLLFLFYNNTIQTNKKETKTHTATKQFTYILWGGVKQTYIQGIIFQCSIFLFQMNKMIIFINTVVFLLL